MEKNIVKLLEQEKNNMYLTYEFILFTAVFFLDCT